ncbi:IS110 family transposase [Cryobacterium psychrophilum]|uniref:IS110 family transposase n=1 Tax=Cryobacterium psychrophilum TaxID=41988 RepID=A0A4Y8KQX7_9MICO|nr:IS110 family transposase [Cryobacterium psychrophilum]TDW29525.1 transposase [Cryobacterium psychrophilum]TFD81663.1 IS110 family transposase [Cryobacterium psychrophilum]
MTATTHLSSLDSDHIPPGIYVGVDTHKDTHHVAAVDELGRALADKEILAVGSGYSQSLDFLHSLGIVQAVGVEGTGSYGAELARTLATAGMRVVDVARTDRSERRLRGKSDPIDARQAALSVLAGRGLATPKQRDGRAESIRMLLAERSSAAKARTATINQIHAQLVTAPEAVRADFRRYEGEKLLQVVGRTRPLKGATPDHTSRLCLKRLAQRTQMLEGEIVDIDAQLGDLTRLSNPALLSAHGVGPVVAGTLLATLGDNPDRIGNKAQFAAICGVAPIPASSGVRHRHRLSRGGDRQANAALHRIVLSRRRHKDPRTMAYFDKRRAEGLSDRDIVRCIERHVANEIFALLTNPEISTPQGPLLRQRRQTLQLAMTEVAHQMGVPYQRLRRLELGERSDAELQNTYETWLDKLTEDESSTAQKAA